MKLNQLLSSIRNQGEHVFDIFYHLISCISSISQEVSTETTNLQVRQEIENKWRKSIISAKIKFLHYVVTFKFFLALVIFKSFIVLFYILLFIMAPTGKYFIYKFYHFC